MVHVAAKRVISPRGKNENACEMKKSEKRPAKLLLYKFKTLLFPLSSNLLKLPVVFADDGKAMCQNWENAKKGTSGASAESEQTQIYDILTAVAVVIA